MRKTLIFVTALAGAIVVNGTANQAVRADALKDKTTSLLATTLAGVEGKEVNVLHLSIPPGFVTPKHLHPGQMFVYVVEGAITIEIDGKAPIKLGPGDVLEELPNNAMVGRNLSTTHGAELVVFQIGDKGNPITVNVE